MIEGVKMKITFENLSKEDKVFQASVIQTTIIDNPYSYSIYLHAKPYFKDEGQCVLMLYDNDRLIYPHHLAYVHNLQQYSEYTGVAPMTEDNKLITTYNEYTANLSPTPKDIEDLCGYISHELTRMKEYIKLKKIKDDF